MRVILCVLLISPFKTTFSFKENSVRPELSWAQIDNKLKIQFTSFCMKSLKLMLGQLNNILNTVYIEQSLSLKNNDLSNPDK